MHRRFGAVGRSGCATVPRPKQAECHDVFPTTPSLRLFLLGHLRYSPKTCRAVDDDSSERNRKHLRASGFCPSQGASPPVVLVSGTWENGQARLEH